jgi:alkanesulfonate monooxygenase SsuD/methylene tetrahydromethanopterin reductase-like flavin-dependent oxidoreductase (luciferase family)
MHLGVMPPCHGHFLSSPDLVAGYAQAAESAGFESIWVFEHAVIPADYASRYPYNPEGRITIEDDDLPDPLTLLAYLAGVTDRLRLGTGVLILPQRSPVLCAKECATIDSLSNGRMLLGIGVGWLREEAEAVGTSFDNRGARTDEAIEVMRTLWRDEEATFDGRFTSFARRSDMDQAARDAGRDPSKIEITYSGPAKPDLVRRYADEGVTRWVVPVWQPDLESCKRALGETADTLMRI